MVAMSMADGYARLTGKPQCVIVHVDVGTQGLGAAVHNSSTGRAPVLIFSGISPFTIEGEMRGSRTEYSQWIQDIPDQKLILGQYCRYTAELKTGRNVKQMVNRALSFAKSAPAGPTYLCAAREVMEEEIKPYKLRQEHWSSVQLGGLPDPAVQQIAEALAGAKEPLLITGYAGRNHAFAPALAKLADAVPKLRVLDTGGSDMCFPADHPAWLGLRFGSHDAIRTADVIVVLDCDVPWVHTICLPKEDARVFHIDCDPLKKIMPVFYIAAQQRFLADSLLSVQQLTDHFKASPVPSLEGQEERVASHKALLATIDEASRPLEDGSFGTGYLTKKLRDICPEDTIYAIEAVTNTTFLHDNLQPTQPGQWINCGGGGLGWSGGAALGIKVATDYENGGTNKGRFVCQIVGDGTFLFSVPSSVYWISRRYNIPVLTIVLNNKGMLPSLFFLYFLLFLFSFFWGGGEVRKSLTPPGWNAPRRSLLLVHPDGLGSKATNEEINIELSPSPDYGGIAKAAAAGELFAARVDQSSELESVLKQAVESVLSGTSAVVDCKVVKGS